jgi:dipeptidyl aminopeptidase/acylaminoacyl peptidase
MRTWRVPAAGGPLKPELVYPAVGALSRDGRKLAYTQFQNGEQPAIWRADLSGPGGQVLRNRKLIYSQYMDDTAQPSPDGTRLALQSARSGAPEIWLNSVEGDHPVQLTFFGDFAGTPRWSPDGQRIAFDAWTRNDANIYIVDSEGRNLHAITRGETMNVVPSWSRDGNSIYYSSNRTGSFQIWKHSLEDGSEKRMTSAGGFNPFESYDGKTIYYSKRDEAGLWSMPAAGGSESRLIQGKPQLIYWGHWAVTQDGLYLLNTDAKPRPTIEFYSFATRRFTPVLTLEKQPSQWQPSLSASRDGRTLYYSQRDPQSSITLVENLP